MNIIYISNLSGNKFAGPNHSVPNQIYAQSKIDNVYWVNLNNNILPYDKHKICHKIDDVGKNIPEDLPEPFNKPDCIIFEEFYCYGFNGIVRQIIRKEIPYFIIPRSQLTINAKSRKKIKKKLADLLFFNKFLKNASGIHYLTKSEMMESVAAKDIPGFIIPNGINIPSKSKKYFKNKNEVNITYIGRLEKYQKGLDLLVKACNFIKSSLIKNNVKVNLYGNSQDKTVEFLIEYCKYNNLEGIINIYDSVFDQEKENILLKSDYFIMTSRFEGMPMGLIEALSYGVPCIVTEGTNLKDLIVKHKAGWGCNNNVNDISDKIEKAIFEKKKLEQYSKNAVKLAAKFNWDNISKKSHKEYSQIINNLKLL